MVLEGGGETGGRNKGGEKGGEGVLEEAGQVDGAFRDISPRDVRFNGADGSFAYQLEAHVAKGGLRRKK